MCIKPAYIIPSDCGKNKPAFLLFFRTSKAMNNFLKHNEEGNSEKIKAMFKRGSVKKIKH